MGGSPSARPWTRRQRRQSKRRFCIAPRLPFEVKFRVSDGVWYVRGALRWWGGGGDREGGGSSSGWDDELISFLSHHFFPMSVLPGFFRVRLNISPVYFDERYGNPREVIALSLQPSLFCLLWLALLLHSTSLRLRLVVNLV